MSTSPLFHAFCASAVLCPALFISASLPAQQARLTRQTPDSVISLAPDTGSGTLHAASVPGEPSFEHVPANFHAFTSARVGEDAGVEPLTLKFTGTTQMTKIELKSKDFVLESGGTCHEGNRYSSGESCTLAVRFSPQGAGMRTGKIVIQHTASATPLALGIGGYGYAPVLSFIPAKITTLAGTYPLRTPGCSAARKTSLWTATIRST